MRNEKTLEMMRMRLNRTGKNYLKILEDNGRDFFAMTNDEEDDEMRIIR